MLPLSQCLPWRHTIGPCHQLITLVFAPTWLWPSEMLRSLAMSTHWTAPENSQEDTCFSATSTLSKDIVRVPARRHVRPKICAARCMSYLMRYHDQFVFEHKLNSVLDLGGNHLMYVASSQTLSRPEGVANAPINPCKELGCHPMGDKSGRPLMLQIHLSACIRILLLSTASARGHNDAHTEPCDHKHAMRAALEDMQRFEDVCSGMDLVLGNIDPVGARQRNQ